MKKILIFSAMLTIAMSSCSKTEVAESTASSAIGFDTFIDKNVSAKATVTTIETIDGAAMYAYYTAANSWSGRASVDTFMSGEALTINDGGTTSYTNTAYWPADGGKVSFFSYGPYEAEGTNPSITANKATIDDAFSISYVTAANEADQFDVVVSQNLDMSKNNYDETKKDVALTYDHILSKIGMSAKLAGTYDHTEVSVTSVVINYAGGDVMTTGKYAFDNTANGAGTWDLNEETFFVATDNSGELSTTNNVIEHSTDEKVSTPITENFLMLIPQKLANKGSLTATIKYDVKNTGTDFVAHYTSTIDLPAQTLEAGKQYNFVVSINLTRYAIDFVTTKVNAFADPLDIPADSITPSEE